MIIEYIRYRIKATQQSDFEAAYARAQQALKASPHCLRYELAHCLEEPEHYILRIEWDSQEGHLQGFRQSPEFQAFLQDVRPFFNDIEEMRHYDVTRVRSEAT